MPQGLREQALQRSRQIAPVFSAAAVPMPTEPITEETPLPTLPQTVPHRPSVKPQDPLSSLLTQLGLDSDQLILLALLIVLYYDHASPKILLAVLYLML